MKECSRPEPLPFSEVQREIADKLRTEIWQERLKAWIKKVREQTETQVFLSSE